MFGEYKKKDAFRIGLAMSDAATGGEYSAGVMEFFLHAMVEWEKVKSEEKEDSTPKTAPWDVIIDELVGTSAGGYVFLIPCFLKYSRNQLALLLFYL